MSDVIIAIVPAPGHEGLVAEGPMGERPALLCRFGASSKWGPFDADFAGEAAAAGADFREREWQWALVLFAPGGPRLGMVRAMEAAFGDEHEAAVVRWDGEHEGWLSDRDGETLCDWPVPQREGLPALGLAAYALAHLLHQLGKGSEVLVLPVPP